MHIRRIAASACALCLAVPAVAAAQPIRNAPVHPAQHAAATAPVAAGGGPGDEWRVAAIAEASLLAAGAAGAGLALARRRRGSQLGV